MPWRGGATWASAASVGQPPVEKGDVAVLLNLEMSTDRDESSSRADGREHRRWLIGLGISLIFGLFGVVMALLSYSQKTNRSAPAEVNAPPAPAAEPKHGGGQRDRRR